MKMGIRCRSLPPASITKFSHRPFCRVLLLLGLLSFNLFIPSQNTAQSLHPTQDDVEAAYLYNFGKFVHWPEDEQHQPLNVCILGQDPFGPALDRLVANELIDGRQLAVVRLSNTDPIQSCSILFISGSEIPRLEKELSSVTTLPIMTVSDMPGFVDHGGMIQFVLKDGRVRFEVNLDAANKCGLALSSQLLKLAVKVMGTAAGRVAR